MLVSALVSGLLGHEGLSLAATARISISTSVRRTKTIRIIGIRIVYMLRTNNFINRNLI